MSYEGVPDEALEMLIKEARDELAQRRRGVSPRTLGSFLDLESPNFMGMGMSIRELVATNQIERNLRSFGQQVREEQRRRLDYVIRLSVELTKILKVTIQSTGLARQAIADVIEGDWLGVKAWAELFAFADEPHDHLEIVAAYAPFRALLVEALATVPKPPEPVTPPGN